MGSKLLLYDGSNYSDIAANYISIITDRKIDLVKSNSEARDILSNNSKEYIAMLTEPMTYFTRTHLREEYRNFLEEVRTKMNLPVIIYTTQDKNTSDKGWGIEEWELVKGKHYDEFISKDDYGSKKRLIFTLEEISKKG